MKFKPGDIVEFCSGLESGFHKQRFEVVKHTKLYDMNSTLQEGYFVTSLQEFNVNGWHYNIGDTLQFLARNLKILITRKNHLPDWL